MAAQLDFSHYEIRHRAVPHKSANVTENRLYTLHFQEYGSFWFIV